MSRHGSRHQLGTTSSGFFELVLAVRGIVLFIVRKPALRPLAIAKINFDAFAAQSRLLHRAQPSVGVRDEWCVQIYKAFRVFEGAELDKTKALRGTIIAITDHGHILWRRREARIDHVGKSCHECAHHVCVHISVESEQDDIARWLRSDWKAIIPSHQVTMASFIHR